MKPAKFWSPVIPNEEYPITFLYFERPKSAAGDGAYWYSEEAFNELKRQVLERDVTIEQYRRSVSLLKEEIAKIMTDPPFVPCQKTRSR